MNHTATTTTSKVRERQDPLIKRYTGNPEGAQIIDRARTLGGADTDPFHGKVVLGNAAHAVVIPFGIRKAVGGFGDAPNPGDLLCGALAACLDSTIRIIADRMGIRLENLEVCVTAALDVRGTLLVNREVPVEFTGINVDVNILPAVDTDPRIIRKLIAAAERSCVTIQTLMSGVKVTTNVQ